MTDQTLDETSAAVLFDTIDEALGIFKTDTMTQDDWKQWAIQRAKFIEIFANRIPLVFWFPTQKVESVNLLYSDGRFLLTSETAMKDRNVAGILYDANNALTKFNDMLNDERHLV